jgi:hypothetical protein
MNKQEIMSAVSQFCSEYNYPMGSCDLQRGDCIAISNVFVEWIEKNYGVQARLIQGNSFTKPIGTSPQDFWRTAPRQHAMHVVVEIDGHIVDLSGSQFGRQYSDPVYSMDTLKQRWGELYYIEPDPPFVNMFRRDLLARTPESMQQEERLIMQLMKRSGIKNKGSKSQRDINPQNAGGDCFEAAAKFVLNNPDYTLVHGEVMGRGALQDIWFGHAWVEKDGIVREVANGNNIEMTVEVYYLLGTINQPYYQNRKMNPPKNNIIRYSYSELMNMLNEHQTWGPWELVTETGY